ncbi:hypothetical protein [Streptomyces sp. SAI-127]|nr:hypothetical protein [Streptomyces sp. SAI-127]MDH6492129.1 hypothetical protein [Streptomyces sp. SAI-127]
MAVAGHVRLLGAGGPLQQRAPLPRVRSFVNGIKKLPVEITLA